MENFCVVLMKEYETNKIVNSKIKKIEKENKA
jgi:hypothetical protein